MKNIIENQVFGDEELTMMTLPFSEDDIILKNCLLKNIAINFEAPYIIIEDCTFDGQVSIHNKGIGDMDQLIITRAKFTDTTNNLKISSTDILLEKTKLESDLNLELVGVEIAIQESMLDANLTVTYFEELSFENSNIKNLTGLNSVKNPEGSFTSKNTSINGSVLEDGLIPVKSINYQKRSR